MDQFNWTLVGVIALPFLIILAVWPWLAPGYLAGALAMFVSMFMYASSYRYQQRLRRRR